MTSTTKKILVSALALLAVFALACGGGDSRPLDGHSPTEGSANIVSSTILPA